jgi:putative hydrolase of the HAD superfamily
MMNAYDNYIFDLYGTLVDIHTDEWKASFWKKMAVYFGQEGASYSYRELKEAYFSKVKELEKRKAEKGHHIEIDIKEVFCYLYKDKGIDADERRIVRTASYFRQASLSRLRLYAGAKELLTFLKKEGKGIYLLSNAQELFTLNEIKELGIEDLFDDILISSAIGYKKPDPAFFKALLKKHHLNQKKCLMIGNDPICDIEAALAVGMDAYYIHSALSPKGISTKKATYSMENMDLKNLRKQIRRSFK